MQFTLSFTIKKEIAFLTYIPTLLKAFKAFFKTTHDLTVLLDVIRYLVDVYKSFKAYEIIHYKKKKKKKKTYCLIDGLKRGILLRVLENDLSFYLEK